MRPPPHPVRRIRSGTRRIFSNEAGAAIVEMAVISSVLMMILLGIVSFGLTHYQNISIEGAAREASRFGATYPVSDAGSMEQWLRDVAQVAENAATGAVAGTEPSRVVCVAHGSGTAAADFTRVNVVGTAVIGTAVEETGWCFPNTAPPNDLVVQVHLEREGWIEGIIFSMKPTLTGEATNRFERSDS